MAVREQQQDRGRAPGRPVIDLNTRIGDAKVLVKQGAEIRGALAKILLERM
jgi:hypothetical protein